MVTSSSASDTHGTPARILTLIRAAVALPVLLFAVVAYWMRTTGQQPPVEPGVDATFTYAVAAWSLMVAVGLGIVKRLWTAAPTRAQRGSLGIGGWAMGESAALFGVVSYFVAGEPLRMLPGLLLLAVSLLLFPVPADEAR